ncbi:hypothetical protein AVEN_252714-1 [Araneus ventricosus]|uniref:Uncharacterized protein n=1 Tax=Araneus ventricosus TaxID=182803 RepID=A0A4Y2W3E4_ARAVE|nr:hypothetical protein AVEN_252714-1 [Araneus ventricosus]
MEKKKRKYVVLPSLGKKPQPWSKKNPFRLSEGTLFSCCSKELKVLIASSGSQRFGLLWASVQPSKPGGQPLRHVLRADDSRVSRTAVHLVLDGEVGQAVVIGFILGTCRIRLPGGGCGA